MYGSVSSALLNMYADVYVQENVQDEVSGEIKRDWVFSKKIICHIDIISSIGARTPDNNKIFGEKYTEDEKMRMKTKEPLSKRIRIVNIRNREGQTIFFEPDQLNTPPTIFEIESHHPRLDPLGYVLYYESNLRRVSVQSNDRN